MIKLAAGVSKKSVVDVYVTLSVPDSPVLSTAQKSVELNVEKRRCPPRRLRQGKGSSYVNVGLEDRLNSRPLDLHTPANQCIKRIQAAVGQLFRAFLIQRDFVETHTPKLVAGASGSGANCFTLKYFD
ncbi:tRNA synthetases class II [Phytophthora infestans]|uniref:tRNA synthetases class II n=1 Tax=Phytophthora infestans TaxID=4787 RepID=A0A8S9TUU9_PHYIN|nr:tRNA synthetases class II [Phytophthora infestans]